MSFQLDSGAHLVIALYLGALVVVGLWARRSQKERSLKDFYLAGKGFGPLVLVLTLYATQYSGNTLFGFSGKAYRTGFSWLMSVHFMTAIIVAYLLFAPALYKLSKRHAFITPADFLDHRYRSKSFSFLASLIMIICLSNYLIAQLMAMGKVAEDLLQIDPATAYAMGVATFALIVVIYETLGGMRAVAWTDAIQGFVLMTGFLILICVIFVEFGSLSEGTLQLLQDPASRHKVEAPGGSTLASWVSYILLVGLGGALYPQAIQRIYSAESGLSLRRSFQIMAFLPLLTALIAVMVGVVGAAHFSGLSGAESDRILIMIMTVIQENSTLGYWLMVVLFAAILAAVMSTADSALLSISSMITKDIYARVQTRHTSDARLTYIGKWISWLLMLIMVMLALQLRGTTLVKMLDRKFDLLVQLVPAFMIGIHWRGLKTRAVFAGFLAGLLLSLTLAICGYGKLWGFHAGLYGLALNLLISVGGSWSSSKIER